MTAAMEPGKAGYDFVQTDKGRVRKRFIQYAMYESCRCGNRINWFVTSTAGRPSSGKRFKQCHECASRECVNQWF